MKKFVQIAFLLIGGALGLVFLPPLYELLHLSSNPWLDNPYVSVALGALLLFTLSFAFSDYFVRLISWMEEVLFKVPIGDLLFGTFGLIIGLIVAYFLGFAIDSVKFPVITEVLPIILSFVLGYLGFRLGFRKRDELIQLFTLRSTNTKKKAAEGAEAQEVRGSYKLLDTSVIIDGRIADISETGFIEGILVVPQFVLTELQHIADSSDTLKRTRGRRGLDILKKLQDERKTKVEITDEDFEDVQEVDLKLVRLAKKMGNDTCIVTNDFNLNKVCELHHVKVLNINDLANAVKPVVIPGEDMQVVVIKDGKEHNQGVAYLDDGTMIVVEGGRSYIGQAITVTVTSVLQTSAGRMIFAKPKDD
ncbi:PIN/TRAM domain-containing protein [Lysinibacillus sp. OL1_EC]|uniref:PIN/TRAM domain-containing protein n=1 Tax=Lysinibacillus TaxID=400634 RepID=UPI001039C739|nr:MULTISPECIES: PIN/TRAM domain-containing protein [unclassified Lysinibacillus]MBX8945707.1 PIN/TRAM domain-containing protein [Lysinibacillus sp. K60]MCM0625842.1 PIN/TRAM domain-containing protein [Lysinibacillus sp. OL1_EC]TBV86282.1 PIN/TRAM domain-containing protein [Lysinibacillus sp. OL1]UKJ45363.1 PIN/TRAM domain-containing protein [Lysinibacillus sp. ACHW1.5]WGT37557.1 PIN/TRAM domain-containing protein [Lysinibacillus sp. 1 U-2021]